MMPPVALPPGLRLDSVSKVGAETNSVYFCEGAYGARPVRGYLKVADRSTRALANEAAVLARITGMGIPVPELIVSGGQETPFLFVVESPGITLWDAIDPRRPRYDPAGVAGCLRAYGRMLARIHALPVQWPPQPRRRLENPIGEETLPDDRFHAAVEWLRAQAPRNRTQVFVHGDFNVTNVLVEDEAVSGVLDWEFAGTGWKEYELAWALRAHTRFLDSPGERDAVLSGYDSAGRFDPDQLRWCEVLNYLHFAWWDRNADPEYTSFALGRAAAMLS